MIEPMVHLTLVFPPDARQSLLTDLQKLGVIHLSAAPAEEPKSVARMGKAVTDIREATTFLSGVSGPRDAATTPPEREPDADRIVRKIRSLRNKTEDLEGKIAQVAAERERSVRWGGMDRSRIEAIGQAGYRITLHSAPRTTALRIEAEFAEKEDHAVTRLGEERGMVYFALVQPAEGPETTVTAAEEPLPEHTEAELTDRKSKLETELSQTNAELAGLTRHIPFLRKRLRELENEIARNSAAAAAVPVAEGAAQLLTGWIPARRQGEVESFAESERAVAIFSEVSADEPQMEAALKATAHPPETDEEAPAGASEEANGSATAAADESPAEPPVLLRNGAFTRLFEPILKIFSLPSYHELDTTPFFAPFYTLFFGLCVADAGYGVLLLLVGFVVLALVKRDAMKPILYLGLVLSASVVVAGILLGDVFGIGLKQMFGSHSALAHLVLFGSTNSAMLFAIMLGVIQVIFGYVLRTINETRSKGPLGALRPVGVLFLLAGIVLVALHMAGPGFAIGPIPFGAAAAAFPAATAGYVMIASGLVLILLFNSLDKKIYLRPLLGIWELYEIATGIPGDILSYLRLFALGLSGGLLGEAIIKIALMVRGDTLLGIIPMILILLAGTGLNLAIGLLSAFVHSLRLTFVEFYKAVGFKGGGIAYSPFKLR